MKTIVVNLKTEPFDVYIGRGSRWGNPYKIIEGRTREEAIALYEDWILRCPHLLARLPELVGKRLGCYCVPQACHGDVLVRLLIERNVSLPR